MTNLCLTLTETDLNTAEQTLKAHRQWIQCFELRIDYLEREQRSMVPSWVDHQCLALGFPWAIITFRGPEDGSPFESTVNQRSEELKRIFSHSQAHFAYVDLEQQHRDPELIDVVRTNSKGLIRSYHDFSGDPIDGAAMTLLLDELGSDGDIPKLALMASGLGQSIELARTIGLWKTAHPSRDVIALAMGEYGQWTRIAAGKIGSLVSYGSGVGSSLVAPGHVDVETLASLYDAAKVDEDTKLFAIVGNPVAQSASPRYHNPYMRPKGLYLPLKVDDFAAFRDLAHWWPLSGASVTIPHKEAALAFGRPDQRAQLVGASNTLIAKPEGHYSAHNSDVDGILIPLEEKAHLLKRIDSIVVIGAGGAARAAVMAATIKGWTVHLINRTVEKAKRLVQDFSHLGSVYAHSLDEKVAVLARYGQVVIQCTSQGMVPWEGEDPCEGYDFSRTLVYFETIYKPTETVAVKRAQKTGVEIVYGNQMFQAQAAAQKKLFSDLL